MTERLTVILDGTVAGTVTRLRGGRLRLDYGDSYRGEASTTPISVAMPKVAGAARAAARLSTPEARPRQDGRPAGSPPR